MKSLVTTTGAIAIPFYDGEMSMLPFDMSTLEGLPDSLKQTAEKMLSGISHRVGEAFFTIHGKTLKKSQTLRRGGPHIDGSYDKAVFNWGGGGGWKVGENGPGTSTEDHARLYLSNKGGILLASNFESCLGWTGEFDGTPGRGGDCSHIELNSPFMLKRDTVYYGNNHFIHESLPISADFHRVMVRITLPESHVFEG